MLTFNKNNPQNSLDLLDDLDLQGVPIEKQIECVKRELKFRFEVYNRRIAAGKMTAEKANYEFHTMQAVLRTLLALKK